MKTSREEKIKYIEKGSSISKELIELSPKFILDVGACDGLDSIIYSRLLPDATIYAFEARRDNYQEIIENIETFGCTNIIPGNFCLNDCAEITNFFNSRGDSGTKQGWDTSNKSSSLLAPTGHLKEHTWCNFDEEKIQTMRFDSLGIKQIDFIHLDVQGAEIKLLQGMGRVFDTVKMIWCEVAVTELYAGQPLKKDIEGFLTHAGFRKIIDTNYRYGDQLWLR
jgi:2-O-methyltransferase